MDHKGAILQLQGLCCMLYCFCQTPGVLNILCNALVIKIMFKSKFRWVIYAFSSVLCPIQGEAWLFEKVLECSSWSISLLL